MHNSWILCLIALLCVAEGARKPTPAPKAKAGGDLTDECPEPNGYFADGYQCDKYYECRDGVIEEKLCPDGMVFNDYSPQVEKCDLPFNIDCSERPERQTPKPSTHCPRQNGYFAHEEENICDKFYFCVDGKYNMITCPSGLVYNEKTGICTWPDEAKKKGCSSEGNAVREKRLTFYPKKELEEEEAAAGSHEASGEENQENKSGEESDEYNDYDDVTPYQKNNYDEQEPKYDFSTDPDFTDFDVDFENFGGSKEDGDYYNPESIQRRQDEMLDGYIREYVAQLNKDPVKASGPMDLSYYEKIAEATVEKGHKAFLPPTDTACFGNVFQFACPKVDMTQAQQHPRYPDPEDCQFFYVCINGEVPRRNGCKRGQVFNEATGACDWPRNVAECKDWYKGILTDEELYALEHPKPRTRSNSTAAQQRHRKPSQQTRVE